MFWKNILKFIHLQFFPLIACLITSLWRNMDQTRWFSFVLRGPGKKSNTYYVLSTKIVLIAQKSTSYIYIEPVFWVVNFVPLILFSFTGGVTFASAFSNSNNHDVFYGDKESNIRSMGVTIYFNDNGSFGFVKGIDATRILEQQRKIIDIQSKEYCAYVQCSIWFVRNDIYWTHYDGCKFVANSSCTFTLLSNNCNSNVNYWFDIWGTRKHIYV